MNGISEYRIRPAGPFLISIGISLFVAMALADPVHPLANQNVFLIGMGLSFLVLFATGFLQGFKPLTRGQRLAMNGSIALELALFVARPHITGPLAPAGNWAASLLIVGIHFVPFALMLGFELAILGALCMANAVFAMTTATSPTVWLSIDALLKIGFGIWICFHPRKPAGSIAALRT